MATACRSHGEVLNLADLGSSAGSLYQPDITILGTPINKTRKVKVKGLISGPQDRRNSPSLFKHSAASAGVLGEDRSWYPSPIERILEGLNAFTLYIIRYMLDTIYHVLYTIY